jgi:tetratricopeptide (TPR) repeat protein
MSPFSACVPLFRLLGNCLSAQGKPDEAVAECRAAIRLKPDWAAAHCSLGYALRSQGQLDAAAAEFREALRLNSNIVLAHEGLGRTLWDLGKLDEAAAELRATIRLWPNHYVDHYNLGHVLRAQGKHDEAAAEFRAALRLKPDSAEAHCSLGHVLRSQGDYAGSLAMYRKGHEFGSKQPNWCYPSAQWVAEVEQMLALAERLPALLKGEDRPRDVAERLALARMCYDTKRHAVAARLWAVALEADPKLGDDPRAAHRYNAACAAALAGCGRGQDDPTPDDSTRAEFHRKALAWLRADLALRTNQLDAEAAAVRVALAHWKRDPDLAGVRDPDALAKLTETERASWRNLWSDVEALLTRAEGRAP